MMTEKEIMESLDLNRGEDVFEKAAKIIEWLLDTNWHETWPTEDCKPFGEYIDRFVAELRKQK